MLSMVILAASTAHPTCTPAQEGEDHNVEHGYTSSIDSTSNMYTWHKIMLIISCTTNMYIQQVRLAHEGEDHNAEHVFYSTINMSNRYT